MSRKTPAHHGGKTTDYRVAVYRGLVTDLIGHEKITTTEAKAKQVRSLAEKMITLGKRGGLHNRRLALAYIYRREVTEKLFAELAQRYASRAGGYTRITKIGPRLGDNAEMVQLELVK